ncbi:MAG: hypothetical protein OEY28_08775, partial [Nitrospira sp.]|nr:hypothetical protein [Nitrospira sp.]
LPDGREVPEYPAEAIREALINAIMHRDFGQHSPIQFNWFSDRIEILNAGGLMQCVDPAIFARHAPPPGFRGRRTAYRNEAISEAMRTYEYVQKFGTGIPKIRNSLAANGNPYAWFIWSEVTFQVTLYSVTRPKFETDEEEFEWIKQKEGNEKLGPIMQRMEHKAAMLELQAKEAKADADRAREHSTRDHKAYTKAERALAKAKQQAEASQAEATAARLAQEAAEAAKALADAKAEVEAMRAAAERNARETAEAQRDAAQADARAERNAREAAEARVEMERAKARHALAGLRSSIYVLLSARGIALPQSVRERIEQCEDADQLSRWIAQAATATTADDIIKA